ncbi:hypothetical protein D3C75_987580 [compost metagenome]
MNSGRRIVASAAGIRDFGTRHLNVLVLSVVHKHSASRHPVADNCTCSYDSVPVVDFEPVIIRNLMGRSILIVDPHGWTAAEQGQHMLVILVGRVDIPLAMRR